jgi:ubiquinone/menaquinone biosynthesis C-methylase UbiE
VNNIDCKICNTPLTRSFLAKEMMLGLRNEFTYMECNKCGCLQLFDIPDDLSVYYPKNYYSLDDSPEIHFRGNLKKTIKSIRDNYLITGNGILGFLIQFLYPNKSIEMPNFRKADFRSTDKILDVGSGSGIIPYVFYNAGFTKIEGIDPFLSSDIIYNNGLRIRKGDFLDLNETGWDKIMYNHSFEHLSNPTEHLNKVYNSLNQDGVCIIRIPTASSFAWNKYGVNWVQLDAPRHFFLYTIESLKILAEKCGFTISSISFESTSFQFLGSEQYVKNISLKGDDNSYFNGNSSLFNIEEITKFEKLSKQLNKNKNGDSIAVVLNKIST